MIIPVILAGGSGTRLWPLSRELFPKQLINLYNQDTMIQNTILRLDGIEGMGAPMVICNEDHRFMTAEQLRLIDKDPMAIILEPVGRNTAPAIALAALKLLESNEDPIMLVLPADHVIEKTDAFHQAIATGERLAGQGNLITFGIVPSTPETGYGYIQKGEEIDSESNTCKIARFVEKPDLETAKAYLAANEYCWNSGMFMFKASTIVNEFQKYVPAMLELCKKAMAGGKTDLDFLRIDQAVFEQIEPDSIDYAVMEKTGHGAMIPLDAGWNDLGSFDALWRTGKQNDDANVLDGDVICHDVKNSFIHSGSRLVSAVGLDGFVIVETKDSVLVSPRDRVQDVKKIVNRLKELNREESVCHPRVYRPWGDYETIDTADRYQVKRITVKPGAKLSLQKHFHRAEHWTVVSGTAIVIRGEEEILLKEDESTYIPLGTLHRLENPGKIPLELIEVQSGAYLGEDDIVRFDDVYGRQAD